MLDLAGQQLLLFVGSLSILMLDIAGQFF